MNNLLKPDSKIIRFLARIFDLILLNMLWLLGCLTVVCSGAAITALYTVMFKIMQGKDTGIVKDFLRALRESFILSTPATVLLFTDVMMLMILRYALYAETLVMSPMLFVIIALVTVFLTAVLSYIFPLISRFDNTFTRHLANAVKLAVVNLPVTFLLLAVNLMPLLVGMFVPKLSGVVVAFWAFIGTAAGAYINSFYLNRIFEKGVNNEG